MGRFRERLAAFLYGRNGPDELYKFLWITSFVLLIISTIIRLFVSVIAGNIILLVSVLLVAYTMFRTFSKNIQRRRAENAAYLRIKVKIKSFFTRMKNRRKYKDAFIYVKCPECKNILRFKRVVGEHRAKCPCCNHVFDLNIR